MIAINITIQLLGAFCDRLKLGSIAAPDPVLAKTKADITKKIK